MILEETYYNDLNKELVLSEGVVSKAASILGYANIAGLAGLGAAMIAKSAISKEGKIRKFLSKLFKKNKPDDFEDFSKLKDKASSKRAITNADNWSVKLADVFKAIEMNDWDEASRLYKDGPYYGNEDAIKAIILKTTDVMGEPPMFVYPAGNETYFALKKIIEIKYAKAAAAAIVAALKQNKSYYNDLKNNNLAIKETE